MSDASSRHRTGLIITAMGGLALTVDIPLIRLSHGEPWTVLMLRTGTTFAAALLIWVVWRSFSRNVPSLVPGWWGAASAVFYGLGSIAFVAAVYSTTTANLVFILAFNPMFAALLSFLFLKERIMRPTLIAMAVMIGGVAIIVADGIGLGGLFGDLMAMASAFMIAAAITVSRASGRDMGFTALIGVFFPFLLSAIMVSQVGFHVDAPWWIVLDGALVMPISFFCLAKGPSYISGAEVGMFYLLETVLAPVWVWMIFGEMPTNRSLLGGLLVILALVAHSLWQARASRRSLAMAAL